MSEFFYRRPLIASWLCQLAVAVPVSLVIMWFDQSLAYSYGLGVLVYVVPNSYFTIYAFRYRGAQMAPWISRSFSWGESGKLALTMVGFALVFRFERTVHVPLLFAGFCSMIALQWWIGKRLSQACHAAAQREAAEKTSDLNDY